MIAILVNPESESPTGGQRGEYLEWYNEDPKADQPSVLGERFAVGTPRARHVYEALRKELATIVGVKLGGKVPRGLNVSLAVTELLWEASLRGGHVTRSL